MAACTDIRVATTWAAHPKTRKLRRRLGLGGPLGFIHLLAYAGANCPDGNLSGMSDEDIELAADWEGEPGEFVAAAAAVGFLDGEPGRYRLHDWADHQPWAAGAEDRSERARFAVLCRDYGRTRAVQMMPEYAAKLSGGAGAGSGSDPVDDPVDQVRSSPSPFPSSPFLSKAKATEHSAAPTAPSEGDLPDGLGLIGEPPMLEAPAPADEPPVDPALPKRIRGEKPAQTAVRFPEFWAAYPVKKGRAKALTKWKVKGLDAHADKLIAHVRRMEAEDDQWGRGFIPHGDTYINGERWTDEPMKDRDPRAQTVPAPPPESFGAKAALAKSESKLENALAWIRQQRSNGAYGEGEVADAEMRKAMAEATEKHRNTAASSGEARRPAPT